MTSHQPALSELPAISTAGPRSSSPLGSPRDEKIPSYDEKRGKVDTERTHDSDHEEFDDTIKLDPYVESISK